MAKEIAGMLQLKLDDSAITDRVRSLTLVLLDWREGKMEMREDGPWNWSEIELANHLEHSRSKS